ncbi:MAG: HDOD domain-containing protein [Pirellulaceae bacterium]
MNSLNIQKINPDAIEPLPTTALRLAEECRQPTPQLNVVIELIECDPVLSAKVLAVANSPLYGHSRRISAIPRAAILLGLRTLSNLAITLSTKEVFGKKDICEYRRRLQEHSLATAVTSRLIAAQVGGMDTSTAFLCGLLHDLGKLPFLDHAHAPYVEKCWERQSNADPLLEEEKRFGTNHAKIGAQYISKMALPPDVSMAIADHHTAAAKPYGLADVLTIANCLSKIWLGDEQNSVIAGIEEFLELESEAIEHYEALKCNF